MEGAIYEKLFEIFSKVLCGTIPACSRRFYRKIALLFSSKNSINLHESLSQCSEKNFKQLLNQGL